MAEVNATDVFLDTRRVFNSDETCIRLCLSSGKVIGERAWKNVDEVAPRPEKNNLTFLGTFNAQGDIIAPMVIYPI